MKVKSFPPVSAPRARVLILGSMPGVASLEAGQYYAHPRNLFWPILGRLFAAPVDSYARRVRLIKSNHLALWDVLEHCFRPGSLDSEIDRDSIVVNDFAGFFRRHPRLTHVFFNGTKAEQEFRCRVLPILPQTCRHIAYQRLPSTSPAMAGLGFEEKLKAWEVVRDAAERKPEAPALTRQGGG